MGYGYTTVSALVVEVLVLKVRDRDAGTSQGAQPVGGNATKNKEPDWHALY